MDSLYTGWDWVSYGSKKGGLLVPRSGRLRSIGDERKGDEGLGHRTGDLETPGSLWTLVGFS